MTADVAQRSVATINVTLHLLDIIYIDIDYHNDCEKNQAYICLLRGPHNPLMHNHKENF